MKSIKKVLKKMVYLGVDLTSQTIEKIEDSINELVKNNEISEKEGRKLVAKIIKKTEKKKDYLESKIKTVLEDISLTKKKKGIKNLLTKEELEETLHIEDKK